MKEIKFKPLRRLKTGKIAVASYMQWRKIKVCDYSKFNLIIDDTYKTFPKGEFVYNHKGENLFWRHYNPEEIPMITGYELEDGEMPQYPTQWKADYGMYCAKGLDCDGVPTFSNGTANNIYNSKADMKDFEPLTVEMVEWWFGWFLYQMNNSNLVFGKS